ncbi:MAG: HAD family phosphatase [Chloroflexota bacterium]|nr:HAD family phosphatase [Chloroflexota bacterium]
MNNDAIRAVIFDFGGVLMRTVTRAPRRELEQRLGLESGGADEAVFGSPLWDDVQLGRLSNAEFWADVGRRLGLDTGKSAEFSAAFREAFWSGDRLDEELMTLIHHLHDAGYRTALLSNAPADLRFILDELGIADAFDVTVISGCEGLMKPDPAIFELALARLDVRADEAVFVDDFRVNVAAARQAGLHAVRFRGLAPLRQRLRELDIPAPDPALEPLPDVRAVIFDWGGVIEELTGDAHLTEWEQRLALEPGMLMCVLWGQAWRQLSVGAISEDEYAARVAERLGLSDLKVASLPFSSRAEAGRRFVAEFYSGDRFYRPVAAAVRALRGRYRLALLSNASPGQAGRVREQFGFDIHAEFDVYVNSALVGLRKPDPAIFYLTLEQLDVEPGQALLVDDMIYNVDGARELGIHTIQFVDPATSLAELEALLDFRFADF